jgi:hypothetical protein
VRFTADQYDQAIGALRDGRDQLADGFCCRICHDTGHQAWECGHNPLLAMGTCEGVATQAMQLHDRIHVIEEAMDDADQTEALAEWREDVHDFLHQLAAYDTSMGRRIGPGSVVLPDAEGSAS